MMYTPARDVSSPPSTTTPNVRATSGPPSSTLPDNGTGIESTPFIDYIDRKGGTDRQLPSPNTLPYQPQSSRKYVRWGIAWKPPTLMIGFAFLGFLSAIGHHLYYRALDGHAVGSPTRQQWAFRFGTAFSFLVIALLKAANNAAYSQYVWTLVRKRSFSIATLDKLFSLTSNPTGLVRPDLMIRAKFAFLLALVIWVASLAGIIPPGTLVVVTGITTNVHPTPMMSFDWNLPSFYDAEAFTTLPSANVIEIANEAAENMIVLPLTPPGPNSSFSLQFYGPSVQCSAANTSQQAVFDYYQNTLARALIYTKQTYEEGNFTSDTQNQNAPAAGFPVMLVLSAFAPYEGIQGWLVGNRNPTSVDALNNWNIDLPWGSLGGTGDDPDETPNNPNYPSVVQQLWVQTTDQSFVCMMGNASYNVDFGFVDGVQTMIQYTTSDFQPLSVARLGGDGNPDEPGPYEVNHQTGFEYTYMSVFMAFTSLISGNVSTTITAGYGPDQTSNATLFDSSSRALLNGLSVCDDFLNNYWTENPIGWNYSSPAPYNKSEQTNDTNLNVLNNLFEKPAWMCRNRTLMRAVEDLANNITISMLSSSNLTAPNSTSVPVTFRKTHNIYEYDSRNLIISYSVVILLTLLGIALGIFSFLDNGVAHSSAFSAIVATTRNPHLDIMSEGHSLGALPFDEHASRVKLRFGELVGTAKEDDDARHVGFGLEHDVVTMRKGGKYI